MLKMVISHLISRRDCKDFICLLAAVFILLLYWIYLAFVTQPILVHDAKGYQDLGSLIYQQGWPAYFISGPNREPIYPLLIAWAMRLAGEGSYLIVLKCFQIGTMLATVCLFIALLRRANISRRIILVALFYLGLSPAFVNSGLSVYSEIVTYPVILGIVLLASAAWQRLQKDSLGHAAAWGCSLGVLFVAITLAKGIYEIIFPLFLIPFVIWGIKSWRMKKLHQLRNVSIFILTTLMIFVTCIGYYKSLNQKYNGLFTLTDRGAWALYGNTARRQQPLTVNKFFAGVAYNLLEEEGCRKFFKEETCRFWDVSTSDQIAATKNYEVIKEFRPQDRDRHFAELVRDQILLNPLQYVLLAGLDWVHMFFWESTRIGFVAYPDWADAILDWAPFAKGLRFGVGVTCLLATLFAMVFLWQNRDTQRESACYSTKLWSGLFFAVYLIVCHVTLYSLFATVPRFAFPIAPLLIFVVACAVQIRFAKGGDHEK